MDAFRATTLLQLRNIYADRQTNDQTFYCILFKERLICHKLLFLLFRLCESNQQTDSLAVCDSLCQQHSVQVYPFCMFKLGSSRTVQMSVTYLSPSLRRTNRTAPYRNIQKLILNDFQSLSCQKNNYKKHCTQFSKRKKQ